MKKILHNLNIAAILLIVVACSNSTTKKYEFTLTNNLGSALYDHYVELELKNISVNNPENLNFIVTSDGKEIPLKLTNDSKLGIIVNLEQGEEKLI